MNSLIVFSHLRWNFVYQRPQHLLSRIATRWPVIFIEEPVTGSESDRIEFISVAPGVEVWRPHLCGTHQGMHAQYKDVVQRLVAQALRQHGIEDYWVWFYTPMALPFAELLSPQGVIYDCMDELSMFKGAPPQLLELEADLLRIADIVFTGGRSLHSAKQTRHPNVHCFPSSVDANHFKPGIADHPLQTALPHPRLGYCGVIDERIDMDLIAGVARQRPDWHIVMVGPTAKIDPAGLPKNVNIHWLGQQNYSDLPAFINGWDICLLPFALNDSTKFISPTKTLEYMACGKPSVSTAIQDVVTPYSKVVEIREDAAGFIDACEMILHSSEQERKTHQDAVDQIVANTSWDKTAAAMIDLIAAAQSDRADQPLIATDDALAEPARLASGALVSASTYASASASITASTS